MNFRMIKMYRDADANAGAGAGGQMITATDPTVSSSLEFDTEGNAIFNTGTNKPDAVGNNGSAKTDATRGTDTGATGDTGTTGAGTDTSTSTDTGGEGGTGDDTGTGTGDDEGDEVPFVESCIQTLGYEYTDEEMATFTNDEEGIVNVIKTTARMLADDDIQEDFNNFITQNPEVRELIEAKRAGMLDQFWASKANGGSFEVALAEDNKDAHYKIIKDNLMATGLPESAADMTAKNIVDAGESYDVAKSIVDKRNAEFANKRQQQLDARQAEDARQEEIRQAQITEEINLIKGGKVGDIVIPEARRDAFINAYYKDAQDPRFPGRTAVAIKLATMPAEAKMKFAYFVHCDFNVDDMVKATIKRQSADALKKPRITASGKAATSNPNKDEHYEFDKPSVPNA